MEIKRKPVPSPSPMKYGVVQRPLTPNPQPPPPYSSASPTTQPAPVSSASSLQPPRSLPRHRSNPNLASSSGSLSPPLPVVPRAETSLPGTSKSSSFYEDSRHFLGGLIHHPSESTKHYSILRHSHGVIFYRGPTTSVTVSVFADTLLPPDRSFWLQSKGWSGKTGMRAKALLHLHDDWVNITPDIPLQVDQIEPSTERAWQRDIAKFRKKAAARIRDTHRLRETVVARIPPDSGDGYFQLVLCHGEKKVLCRSPVFRLFSTSADPSSLRGASLASMPLEVGAMILGSYARTAAQTVITPVTTVAQSAINPYKPSWLQQTAATTVASAAYSSSGLADRFSGARDGPEPSSSSPAAAGPPPALENGPQPPFPIDITARPIQALDVTRLAVKIPSITEDKLRGFFFGWARSTNPDNNPGPWGPIILSVRAWDAASSQSTGPISLSQTTRRTTVLRFLDDTTSTTTTHPARTRAPIQIRVLGFLRPDITPPPTPRTEKDLVAAREAAGEAAVLADQYDAEYVQGVLEHPLWAAEPASGAHRGRGWVERTREGYESVWTRGQKMAERVGVRSGLDQECMGGFYIVRG